MTHKRYSNVFSLSALLPECSWKISKRRRYTLTVCKTEWKSKNILAREKCLLNGWIKIIIVSLVGRLLRYKSFICLQKQEWLTFRIFLSRTLAELISPKNRPSPSQTIQSLLANIVSYHWDICTFPPNQLDHKTSDWKKTFLTGFKD